MKIDTETEKKIEELQALESHLQNFLAQRQSLNIEINEIDNALNEIKNTEEVYKISLGTMFKSSKELVEKELDEKKKIAKLKIDAIEKQEKMLEKSYSSLKTDLDKVFSLDKKSKT